MDTTHTTATATRTPDQEKGLTALKARQDKRLAAIAAANSDRIRKSGAAVCSQCKSCVAVDDSGICYECRTAPQRMQQAAVEARATEAYEPVAPPPPPPARCHVCGERHGDHEEC